MDFVSFQVRSAIIGNYKDDRLFGRGKEYAELIISNAIKDIKENGKIWISKFESKSGNAVCFRLDGKLLIED